jgi:hypothetical protein
MPDRTLPGLGLKGFWPLGESGWNGDMDINLLKLSVVAGGSALALVNADPGAPVNGDINLLSDTHATHPGEIAVRDAGAWIYFPVPVGCIMYDAATSQHRQFDGTTWAVLATAGGGGGPSGVIGGVTITGATVNIGTDSLVAADSADIAISYWVRYPDLAAVRNAMSFANDVANEYGIWSGNWNGGANDQKFAAVFQDEATSDFQRIVGPDAAPQGVWIHYLVIFKGAADGALHNQIIVYRNRVKQVVTYSTDAYRSIVPTLNGKSFYVASDSYNSACVFDFAEFWLQTGYNFLEADHTVSPANLDKFIDATLKPVSLGADGSAPTGTAPVIYMHRDAAESAATFADNLGTGGAFTLEGILGDPVDNPGD